MTTSRRDFLRLSSLMATSGVLGLRSIAGLPLYAQSSSDYKALVCIFLLGGNDANNTIVPVDTPGYSNYASIRGSLAISKQNLRPLNVPGSLALHPSLTNLQSLCNAGSAAILANVGPLSQPITRAQYQANLSARPYNLYSHRDQQITWQTANPAVSGHQGWAGMIADQGSIQSGLVPSVISMAGASVFQSGLKTSGVAVPLTTSFSIPCREKVANGCAIRNATSQQILTVDTGMTLVQADNVLTEDTYDYFSLFRQAFASSTLVKTAFPNTSIGLQLQQIANVMASRQALGASRQIFYASLGSFDTHSVQSSQQTALLSHLDTSLAAFQTAMVELSLSNNVTAFTMSDFSRAMVPNSAAGTDHAWGGHHFVVGGAVKGGQVYGTMPQLELGGPDDAEAIGRWIPSTSASQYTATLANWFGVPWTDMPKVVANIGNFPQTPLSFFK
jgi:uncharacterized protein (DUF1501 family)